MSLELVANDGRSTVLPLFASTNEIRVQTIRIKLGSTMVELSTTDQANSSASLDVALQRQQDPVPPLPSFRDATAATSSPQEITPSPQPQPQATEASATSATGTTEVAPAENQQKKHDESKKEHRKQEEWLSNMRGWLLMVATVFATMTYQAGLNPPGGFWQDDLPSQPSGNDTSITNVITPCHMNTTIVCITSSDMATPSNKTTHERFQELLQSKKNTTHVAGHAILQEKNRERYVMFFWTNSIAFIYSMGSIVLLLSETVSIKLDRDGLKSVIDADIIHFCTCFRAARRPRSPSTDFRASDFQGTALQGIRCTILLDSSLIRLRTSIRTRGPPPD